MLGGLILVGVDKVGQQVGKWQHYVCVKVEDSCWEAGCGFDSM